MTLTCREPVALYGGPIGQWLKTFAILGRLRVWFFVQFHEVGSMDLVSLFSGLAGWQWLLLSAGLLVWLGMTWWLGSLTERHGGDRESGALVGFFAPLLLALLIYWITG